MLCRMEPFESFPYAFQRHLQHPTPSSRQQERQYGSRRTYARDAYDDEAGPSNASTSRSFYDERYAKDSPAPTNYVDAAKVARSQHANYLAERSSVPYGGETSVSASSHHHQHAPSSWIVDEADEAPTPTFFPTVLLNVDDEPRSYHLVIRQSPKHGQMCTLGSKLRRILDPLPIVELEMRTKDGVRDTVGQASPFLLMQVSLLADRIDNRAKKNATSFDSDTFHDEQQRYPLLPPPHQSTFAHQRLIEGKLYASAQIVRDTSEEESTKRGGGGGVEEVKSRSSSVRTTTSTERETPTEHAKVCLFLFTDLSIRMCGTFRLHFSLVRLGGGSSGSLTTTHTTTGQIVAECTSDAFPVVPFREFEGLSESTALAKSLASQGVHIPIRNETRWRASRRRRSTMTLDETRADTSEQD